MRKKLSKAERIGLASTGLLMIVYSQYFIRIFLAHDKLSTSDIVKIVACSVGIMVGIYAIKVGVTGKGADQ